MEVPEGLEDVPEGHALLLIKALYSLKQAGRQWYQTLKSIMEKFGMKQVESDPHTFMTRKVVRGEQKHQSSQFTWTICSPSATKS